MKPTTNQIAASRIRLNRVVIKKGYANFVSCVGRSQLFRSGAEYPPGLIPNHFQLGLKRGALDAEARRHRLNRAGRYTPEGRAECG